jgi:hypothetical protein
MKGEKNKRSMGHIAHLRHLGNIKHFLFTYAFYFGFLVDNIYVVFGDQLSRP